MCGVERGHHTQSRGKDGARLQRRVPPEPAVVTCPTLGIPMLTQGILLDEARKRGGGERPHSYVLGEYTIIANTFIVLIMSHSSNTVQILLKPHNHKPVLSTDGESKSRKVEGLVPGEPLRYPVALKEQLCIHH